MPKPLMSPESCKFVGEQAARSVQFRKQARELRKADMLYTARKYEAMARGIEGAIRHLAS